MVTARKAVAGLLCTNQEVLLVKRHVESPAFPGYWACPGGKVEKNEAPPPPKAEYCGFATDALAALQRELNEELGIDIYKLPCRIARLGNALTPKSSPRRFDTDFFRIDFDTRPPIQLDTHEHSEMRWAPATDFWELFKRGEMLCVSPLQHILRTLTTDPHAKEVPQIGHRPGQDYGLDLVEPLDGLRILPLRSNTLPPASHTNAFLLGDNPRQRILVDPSPGDETVYNNLRTFLAEFGAPTAIFISHHHPDHHERANRLAGELHIPLQMSTQTRAYIDRRWGSAYFSGITVQTIEEGQTLCHWHEQAVRAVAVPGHDSGHLALLPDSRHWMIVGDLYQGVGTVVIGQPEGNMRDYFASLKKVIALKPRVTVPSHGIALPGTLQVAKTLLHRQQREARILELHQQGLSINEMLASEYAQVPQPLWPLARMNIEAHLVKIATDLHESEAQENPAL